MLGDMANDIICSSFPSCELHIVRPVSYYQYRTISLMSHVTKLVLRVIMNRIRGRTLSEISEVQYGFMPDRGTRNAIFVLRRLVERMIEKQKDVYVCFIDYSKAFDTVKHEPLIELLQSLDIDPQDVQLLANLYWNQQSAGRHNRQISESINIKQGVRQGCVASSHLFVLYTEMIMHSIDDMEGIKMGGGHVINNRRYADDTVSIAEFKNQLQQLMDTIVEGIVPEQCHVIHYGVLEVWSEAYM